MTSDKYADLNGLIVDTNDNKFWYLNNTLHREDGPAVEYSNGTKFWINNGKLHREDGPAIQYAGGTKEYWYNDEMLDCSTDEEFKSLLKLKLLW